MKLKLTKKWWDPKLGPISLSVSIFIIHIILREVLSRYDIISSIFAAGDHIPRWMISCVGAFMVVRLSAFLLIPVILSWWLTTVIIKQWCDTRCRIR